MPLLAHDARPDDVAVIGLAFRGPQDAATPGKLWRLLLDGRSAASAVPKTKWSHDGHYHPSPARGGSSAARAAHFMDPEAGGVRFDAAFFALSKPEVLSMDLRQRLVLESVYEALENAGLPIDRVRGSRSSVFAAAANDDGRALLAADPDVTTEHQPTGASSAAVSSRVSWFYDLTGCSVTLDTACSSSLVALHMACSDLRQGHSDMSIVCGVNVIESPETMSRLSNLGFLSPEGECFAFDSRANGYARGEGVGAVLLKPVQAAIRDGDTIRAVIRATGVSQDGRGVGEITMPNQQAQEELIRQVYRSADLDLNTTAFVEAHGVGNPVVDAAEAGAIAHVWAERPADQPLYVGAGKTNHGHLEGASGIAAVIKTVLALEQGVIPPNINFEKPNPAIDCDSWKLKFPLSATPWPSEGVRRASINSCGLGGTNAHAVLDDAYSFLKERQLRGLHRTSVSASRRSSTNGDPETRTKYRIFEWSANDAEGIKRSLTSFSEHLKAVDSSEPLDGYLSDLAYTLSEKRSKLPWKIAVAAESLSELSEAISDPAVAKQAVRPGSSPPSVGFIFSGHGAQWYAMGRELLAFPVFKESVELASDFMASLRCPWSVFDELLQSEEESRINDAHIAHTLSTVIQVALVDLLSSWGIAPTRVLGHSTGEIAAAYCAGALDQKSAWKVAYYRGLIASRPPSTKGSMLAALWASASDANNNRYRSLVGDITAGSPAGGKDMLIFSSVSGQMVEGAAMSRPDYWVEALQAPTKFEEALQAMWTVQTPAAESTPPSGDGLPITHILELGPDAALEETVTDLIESEISFEGIKYRSVLVKNKHASLTVLSTVGALYANGYPIDLHRVNHGDEDPQLLVDLPPYSFDRREEYWTESRRSKAWRFREHPRHDILGTIVAEWNSDEPQWRNYIRLSELPWLKDHKIMGRVVLPGVSFLTMAIEGVKQVCAKDGRTLTGFELRDVVISRALQIDEESDTEVMLSMRAESGAAGSPVWYDFKVFSYRNAEDCWLEHCRGSVAAEFSLETGPIDSGREAAESKKYFKEFFDQCEAACLDKKDLRRQYAEFERVGLEFGNLFQNLAEVKCAESTGPVGRAFGSLRVPDIASCMPCGYLQPHVVQPATLDSMTHMVPVALQAAVGAGHMREPMVPAAIKSLWVSSQLETDPDHAFACHASASLSSHNKFAADITVWDEQSRNVRAIFKGLETAPLKDFAEAETGNRQLCFNMSWRPDIDLLGEEAQNCLREAVKPLEEKDAENLKRIQDLQLAAAIYATEAADALEEYSPKDLAPHKQKYLEWIREQARNYEKERLVHQADEWDDIRKDKTRRDAFLKLVEESGPEGQLVVRMGTHIVPVMQGEQDALHLMFMDALLEDYYCNMLGTDKVRALFSAYLGLLSHKSPGLRVCEIGAGMGGTTTSVLETLCPRGARGDGSTRLLNYTYTDISAGFFERARSKFKKWAGVMQFKTLDIEKDLDGQGFEEVEASYDVVIAANVLHGTADLSQTLENVYRLLKPGGKLILQEITQPDFIAGPLCFGLLPDWWRSTEQSRQSGPLLSERGWVTTLRENGFDKTILRVPDSTSPDLRAQTFIVATTPEDESPTPEEEIKRTFIVTSERPLVREQLVADNLAAQLMTMYAGRLDLKVIHWESLHEYDLKDACCVVTVEVDNAFLAGELSSQEMGLLRKMLTTASAAIWVTMDPSESPKVALISGLMRTLRWERELECDLVTVAFEDAERTESEAARHVRRIYRRHFIERRDRHAEYLVRGNLVCTNRLAEAPDVNEFIASTCAKPVPQPQAFGEDRARALKLSIATPGQLDTLQFVDDAEFASPLPDDQIEVEIRASGLSFRDIMAAMGEVPADAGFGHEGAGFVTRVGSRVSDIEVGDRVLVLSPLHGTFQTYTRTPREAAVKMPDEMSFITAAGMPLAFSMAYYCLVDVGRLQTGDTCLIHAAAGGVGQAAIQIAKSQGADIFATVSSEEKRDVLVNAYGIPKDRIFSSRDLSFAKGIMRTTSGRGVDVILNSLPGEALKRSWDCIAPFGRFVEIGKRDVFANAKLGMEPFSRSASFTAVDFHAITKLDTRTTSRVLSHVIELWQKGEIKEATPTTVYTYSQLEESFRLLQEGKHVGKVVLTTNEEDIVNVIPKPRVAARLREDASYVLSGGFGGLGRSIAKWMAIQGAHNLIFLGRSGASREAARDMLENLKKMGVRCAVFECDVSDDAALLAALRSCEESGMPKIAGVIQGATQLKDSAFASMQLEDFKSALVPKVRGSWNLHEYLPKDMDFFIMLSSVSGVVGTKGRANYAAGSTYQDALAHYRRARGLPASTLDLGNILSVGSTAKNKETLNPGPMFLFDDDGIHEEQFLALIEYYVDRQRGQSAEVQVAIGVPTSADFRSRGLPEPSFMKAPLFSQLRPGVESSGAGGIEDDRMSIRTASTRATRRRRTISRRTVSAEIDDDQASIRSSSTRSSWRPGRRVVSKRG